MSGPVVGPASPGLLAPTDAGAPNPIGLVGGRTVQVLRSLWRARTAFVFTFGLPLVWLVLIGIVAGNAVVDPTTGLRVMQFATPAAIAMGCLFATLPSIAIGVAGDRETLALKRLRGTPLPGWVYVLAQVAAVSALGAAAVGVVLAVAVTAYGVEIPGGAALPLAITILVALGSFSAIGIAIGSLLPTARATESVTFAVAVVLAFISGIFVIGTLPDWIDTVAWVGPLKPFVESLQDLFDPYDDPSWNLGTLAVLGAWGVAGSVAAGLAFRWEPRFDRRGRRGRAAPVAAAVGSARTLPAPVEAGATGTAGRVLGLAAAALRSTLRRPGDLFFAVALPVGLMWLLVTLQENGERDGIPIVTSTAAAMCAWGVAVVAFMNTADWVSRAAERGLIKRLRGTPASTAELGAGRGIAALLVSWAIAAALLLLGLLAFGLRTTIGGLALGMGVLLLAVVSLAACGLLLATALPDNRAAGAAALMILFVVAFASDVFLVGGPDWLSRIGLAFPLSHLRIALLEAWRPDGPVLAWASLGVLALWAAAASAAVVLIARSRGAGRTDATVAP
ncbi:ABC transporter permease [Agromyces arachidis]|uniref:ABC transporter permease n=1 Tax=Agromyces arachidis TaxID=766966 RepID=UPI004057C3C5